METRQDLKISGSGSAGGGKYNVVSISGSGKISGDIECQTFKTSGSSSVVGNLKSIIFKTSGSTDVKGNVETRDMVVSGSSRINGEVAAKYLKISGSTEIREGLKGEEIDIKGHLKVTKDCEAEIFKASGGFEIGGLLNAGEVEITLYGNCRAKEIGGEKINVRISNDLASSIFKAIKNIFNKSDYLLTDVIEGDEIFLEATTAKVVRGKNIVIGRECYIEKVEYSGSIKVLDGAKVNEQKLLG